jgi:SAM-dependent methyltransferase
VATDKETPYIDRLRNAFRRRPGMMVERLDLDRDDALDLASNNFDTILCINVLEHTTDDAAALVRANRLLVPGGRIIIFVPAGKDLFGALDRGIGHQRRYDKEELVAMLQTAGFEVEEAVYQNRAAKLAWWLNSNVFKRQALPAAQSKIFDRLVPLLKALDGARPKSGLSLIAVGRKPAS